MKVNRLSVYRGKVHGDLNENIKENKIQGVRIIIWFWVILIVAAATVLIVQGNTGREESKYPYTQSEVILPCSGLMAEYGLNLEEMKIVSRDLLMEEVMNRFQYDMDDGWRAYKIRVVFADDESEDNKFTIEFISKLPQEMYEVGGMVKVYANEAVTRLIMPESIDYDKYGFGQTSYILYDKVLGIELD